MVSLIKPTLLPTANYLKFKYFPLGKTIITTAMHSLTLTSDIYIAIVTPHLHLISSYAQCLHMATAKTNIIVGNWWEFVAD